MNAIIGIDVGATTIAGGLVTPDGVVLHATQTPTHRDGPGTAVKRLLGVVEDLLAVARSNQLDLGGVGVGIAGIVDIERGTMFAVHGNHLPEFSGIPLADTIGAVADLPVFVDNDANALALAEWTFGVARGADSLVLFAVGTEVGGGLILENRLVRGHDGWAGELGHVSIKFDGPACRCGGHGCLGVYLGGRQIAALARDRVRAGGGAMLLASAGGDPQAITSEMVFRAAASGDPVAGAIVDEACEALAAAVGGVVHGLNPEVVVITGGLASSLAPLEADVCRRVSRYAHALALANTRIQVVGGDKRQTVRGGAALVLYEAARAKTPGASRIEVIEPGPRARPGSDRG